MTDKKPTPKKSALGKGLGALLQDSPQKNKSESLMPSYPTAGIFEIFLDEIQVNPYQPRTHFDKDALQELADSILTQGIIQPITVRKLDENEYQLISIKINFKKMMKNHPIEVKAWEKLLRKKKQEQRKDQLKIPLVLVLTLLICFLIFLLGK